jgi:hypothetical protein
LYLNTSRRLVSYAIVVTEILIVVGQVGLPDRRAIATALLLSMDAWPIRKPLIERSRIVVADDVSIARILEHPPGSAHFTALPLEWRKMRTRVPPHSRACLVEMPDMPDLLREDVPKEFIGTARQGRPVGGQRVVYDLVTFR